MSPAVNATLRTNFTVDVEDLNLDERQELRKIIDSAIRRISNPDGEDLILGWTQTTLEAALDRLERAGARVQAEAIRAALKNSGYVTRDRIYKIGRYPKGRTLRGFTRPSNRTVAVMRDAGEVPPDAVDLLTPSYQDGPVADGFRVPAELLQLLR